MNENSDRATLIKSEKKKSISNKHENSKVTPIKSKTKSSHSRHKLEIDLNPVKNTIITPKKIKLEQPSDSLQVVDSTNSNETDNGARGSLTTAKEERASPDLFEDVSSPAPLDTSSFEEKKRQRALAYRKFTQRAGPSNPGSKVVPEVSLYDMLCCQIFFII